MNETKQKEIDTMVTLVKTMIHKYGIMSEKLAEVRKWYLILRECPEIGEAISRSDK